MRSSFNPKVKPEPHVDGIVGCTSTKPMDYIVKKVSQLYINQYTLGQAMALSQPTQTASVLVVQSSDQKGNQQPRRNNKKGKNKTIIRLGIGMKIPILMTRTPEMLGGQAI